MKKHIFLSCICLLILLLLAAAPALAAMVLCPSGCSCLLPAEAAKINTPGLCGGKQMVCGSDGKITQYCYLKPVTTTTVVPQFIVTGHVFTPTTVPAFVKCSPDCSCEYEPEGEIRHLTLCGGTQYICGMDPKGVPKYCYVRPPPTPLNIVPALTGVTLNNSALPAVPPTTFPKPAVSETVTPTATKPAPAGTGSCAPGCTCLRPADAEAKGLRHCNGKQTSCKAPASLTPPGTVSGTGLDKETRYCYSMLAGSSVPAPVLIPAVIKTTPIPILPGPGIASSAAGPAAGGDILSMVGSFLSSVLGGNPQRSPSGEVSLSMCKARYGLDTCADGCVNLSTDPDNCGSCGHWCTGSEQCYNGACVNLETDPLNCGEFGNACPAGAPCLNGYCSRPGCLDSVLTDCGNSCVNLLYDRENCGSCGHACPPSQYCNAGTCTSCANAGEWTCPDPYWFLACTDVSTDLRNCGSCQHACGDDQVCNGGVCITCAEGLTRCGNTCKNLTTDRTSCGRCGLSCNASYPSCCSGTCTNTQDSISSCGSCGHTCGTGEICQRGSCTACPAGTQACDNPPGSVCADLLSSESNCGRCGHRCSSVETCCNGVCYNLNTSELHCGSCSAVCPRDYGCCDGNCINLETDRMHCGTCTTSCNPGETCFARHCI